MVSEELWLWANEAAQRLRGKSTTYKPVHFYPLAGILKCYGCGSNLQGNHTDSGRGYRAYRETASRRGVPCTKPQIAVRADRIELEVDTIVARLHTAAHVSERVLELLSEDGPAGDTGAPQKRIKEQLRRLSRLSEDLEIEEDEYANKRRRLQSELDRLTLPGQKAAEATRQFDVLQLAWSRATPVEKRGLGLALFVAIYFDLAAMEITAVVVQPAFRPRLAEESTG